MKILLIIAASLIGLIILFIAYRTVQVRRQNRRLNGQRFARIQPLHDSLESGGTLTEKQVHPFAENLLTRELCYQLLEERGLTALFPEALVTIVKGAESNLANWLEFPTELGTAPDELEHLKRVSIDFDGHHNFVHYEVFRYRVREPHWAAKHGWILGVAGPYFDDSKPYDFPSATFSRISSTEDRSTPEDEAQWVHDNISKRR